MFEKFFHVNRRSVSRLAPCCLIPRFGPYFSGRRAYTALGNVIVHAMGQERWKPGQSIRIPEHSFLDQLRRFGSDTDRTHDMPFWLYFHGKSTASQAAKRGEAAGLEAEVVASAVKDQGPRGSVFSTAPTYPMNVFLIVSTNSAPTRPMSAAASSMAGRRAWNFQREQV
jgi:hypothetical protein